LQKIQGTRRQRSNKGANTKNPCHKLCADRLAERGGWRVFHVSWGKGKNIRCRDGGGRIKNRKARHEKSGKKDTRNQWSDVNGVGEHKGDNESGRTNQSVKRGRRAILCAGEKKRPLPRHKHFGRSAQKTQVKGKDIGRSWQSLGKGGTLTFQRGGKASAGIGDLGQGSEAVFFREVRKERTKRTYS